MSKDNKSKRKFSDDNDGRRSFKSKQRRTKNILQKIHQDYDQDINAITLD